MSVYVFVDEERDTDRGRERRVQGEMLRCDSSLPPALSVSLVVFSLSH